MNFSPDERQVCLAQVVVLRLHILQNRDEICRRINSTGRCYEDDVAELKARQAEIWELLKVRQRDEL